MVTARSSHCALAMDVSGIISEIASARAFLATRSGDGASGHAMDGIGMHLANQISIQISQLATLSTADATSIANELAGNPYGVEHTKTAQRALDNRLAGSIAATCATSHKPTQHLYEFQNYATQSDWDIFRDRDRPLYVKMERAVLRLKKYGCTNPHEQTFKRVLAILLLCHFPELPTHQQIYDYLQDLKAISAVNNNGWTHSGVFNYPTEPYGCSESIQKNVWDSSDPPIRVELIGMSNFIMNHIPCRRNSRLLRKTPDAMDRGDRGGRPVTWDDLRDVVKGSSDPRITFSLQQNGECDRAPRVELRALAASSHGGSTRDLLALKDRLIIPGGVSNPQLALPAPSAGDAPSNPAVPQIRARGADNEKAADDPGAPSTAPAPEQASKPHEVGDLSDFEKEALEGLRKREEEKKKDEANRKRLAKEAKLAETNDGEPCCKRPAAASGTVMKAIKPFTSVCAPITVTTTSPCPELSTDGTAAPCDYNGGRIYLSLKKKGFRVLRNQKDAYSERFVPWGGDKPTAKTCKDALQKIDEYKKKK